MDDVERNVRRRVFCPLAIRTQVDDGANAVRDGGVPTLLAQLPEAVGADDRPEACLAAVGRAMTAEIADVETTVPVEVARRRHSGGHVRELRAVQRL